MEFPPCSMLQESTSRKKGKLKLQLNSVFVKIENKLDAECYNPNCDTEHHFKC